MAHTKTVDLDIGKGSLLSHQSWSSLTSLESDTNFFWHRRVNSLAAYELIICHVPTKRTYALIIRATDNGSACRNVAVNILHE